MRHFILNCVLLSLFVLQAYANPIEFFVEGMQSILHPPSCVERGGVKLDIPFNGPNCGVGMNQRGCRCGHQCIISGEWCCSGEVCTEDQFLAGYSDQTDRKMASLSSIHISPAFFQQFDFIFQRESCVERGGVKLDRPFNGLNCSIGMNQRDCRCGHQCIISGEWCCSGEVCSEEQFLALYSDWGTVSLTSTQISPSFVDQIGSIFRGNACVERGGIKLDRPLDGLNCGMGKSSRSCTCGNQCITKRQFCCNGVVCDEESFQSFDSHLFILSAGE